MRNLGGSLDLVGEQTQGLEYLNTKNPLSILGNMKPSFGQISAMGLWYKEFPVIISV